MNKIYLLRKPINFIFNSPQLQMWVKDYPLQRLVAEFAEFTPLNLDKVYISKNKV